MIIIWQKGDGNCGIQCPMSGTKNFDFYKITVKFLLKKIDFLPRQ